MGIVKKACPQLLYEIFFWKYDQDDAIFSPFDYGQNDDLPARVRVYCLALGFAGVR